MARVEFRDEEVRKLLGGLRKLGGDLDRIVLRFGHHVAGEAKKHAPVDTGRLRASILPQLVDKGTVAVGTNVRYAPYVELGHKAEILPVRAKALRFYLRGVGWLFRKRVVQGRSGKSAQWIREGDTIKKPFLAPAFEWAKENILAFLLQRLREVVSK